MKQETPTLNIQDLALLKSNPKEYYNKQLEKEDIIEADTVKHPVTERARNIGKTGKWDTEYDEETGEEFNVITYWDGTKLKFMGGIAEVVSPDGETIRYEGNDRVGYYTDGINVLSDNQGSELSKMEGEKKEAFDEICKEFYMVSDYDEYLNGSSDLIKKISEIRSKGGGEKQIAELKEEWQEQYEELIGDKDLQQKIFEGAVDFEEMCKNNHINQSYVTFDWQKELPEDEGIGKRIITNKDWKLEASGRSEEGVAFTEKGPNAYKDGWLIVNMREGSNPANCGIDLTEPCQDYAFPSNPHCQFLTAPGQKTERYIIDEKNKIIVQRPYKAGMQGHY